MVVRIPEKTVTCEKCGKKFTVAGEVLTTPTKCWSCSSVKERLLYAFAPRIYT